MGLSGFNLMMSLRGFENVLMDVALQTDFLTRLMDKVWEFEAGLIEEYAACGVDGVWFFDDWGTEDSLFIRPDAWREIFKPRYREQFRMAHDRGMHVFFHSCGYVWDIIPDLIEIGVDVLNLEQPNIFAADGMSGVDRMASIFGGKVCFCTNPDGQRVLAYASPSEVTQEVKHVISAFSKFGGGLIPLADCGKDHNILPPANIEAMETAFTRFAR
jgi:uroporphyrinogen decarboxylase